MGKTAKRAKRPAVRRSSRRKTVGKHQVNIKNIMLTKESYRQCRKVKNCVHGNLAVAIEGGDWWMASDTHEYADLKDRLETDVKRFYEVDDDVLVEIQYFDSDILSFEKGVHPNWNNGKRA